ncbi:MAG: S8 family serine peptidase [Casimicrobiaceae bacterium]
MRKSSRALYFLRRKLTLIVVPLLLLISAQSALSANPQAARIDTITPPAARSGERVTVSGIGFGGLNVSITVGGIAAAVVAATGNQLTFLVPPDLTPGFQVVNAANPGGHTGSIGFRVLEGILLSGNANAQAINSTFDLPPRAVDKSQVANGLILTRLELRLAPDATVGQVNDALILVQGGIVSMSRGFREMTIAIPRPPTVAALQTGARTLNSAPGIQWVFLAREAASQVLPPVLSFLDQQLLPTRFPAAWNAKRLATGIPAGSIGPITLQDCTTRKVPILVADKFIRPAPASHIAFAQEIPNFLPSPPDELGAETHGYDVTTTLAALFNEHNPTGATPFSQCLDITGVQLAGLGAYDAVDRIERNFPSGKFILNYSIGYNTKCEIEFDLTIGRQTCDPDSIRGSATLPGIVGAFDRAAVAFYWKQKTFSRWPDFFASASAGNASDPTLDGGFAATIYPGLKEALPNSTLSAATDLDPFYGFIQDASLWSNPDFPNVSDLNLTATVLQIAQVRAAVVSTGMDRVGPASNTMIVGSAKQGNTIGDLAESRFSNAGADVLAVGENIITFSGAEQGTSFSAPQVAGLASYLWLLSPTLRGQPSASITTAQAIQANTGTSTNGNEIIDAYATILSLDQAALPMPASAPVRLAILDVNDDGKFDENDLQLFLAKYLDANGKPVEPVAADYSRFDLNGDGFTGGSHVGRFDLDRIGSTQFGTTNYASVTQQIEGKSITFNENAVTDMEVLCYYAYSALYTGDAAVRAQLLAGCAGVHVQIQPTIATLALGATQQFGATVTGAQDIRVTWAVDGVNGGNSTAGTISGAGLYSAPSTAGTHTVRATSIADPRVFGEATVTVRAAGAVRVVRVGAFGHAQACASAPGHDGSCDPKDSAIDTPGVITLHASATMDPAPDGASSASADLVVDGHFELDPVSGSLTSVSGSANATVSATIVNLTLDSGHEAAATATGGMRLDFEITSGSFTFVLNGAIEGDGFAPTLFDADAHPIAQLDGTGTPRTGVLHPSRYFVLGNTDIVTQAGARNLFDTHSESGSHSFTLTLAPAP